MIVYHGSSNKNLRFNPKKPLLFFTTNKEDAKDWADRVILGGKRNKGSYVYSAELNFKNLFSSLLFLECNRIYTNRFLKKMKLVMRFKQDI